MTLTGPTTLEFTRHAERRASERGLKLDDIVGLVLTHHSQRRRNSGAADWIVRAGGISVVYNWPDGNDASALVVSVWRE